ncbi:MAG: nucleoid-associated protein [Verrucomicrobiales bacterium]|nr:nucleoid-associated protein [Verrucomicrobiales bacterium]
MPLTIQFREARLAAMTLARVGNPLRSEPLRTSRALCRYEESEAELLTHCFLKSFRALELHQLHHHSDLRQNELYGYACALFDDNSLLLEQGAAIARHLHAKSNHPNIKSGDLCVALIDGVVAGGESVQALSIVKSESTVPFLQISERDGDLRLTTEQGIYPEKIDKGCLIVNHDRAHGFSVYLFDKSGGGTHFWNRDFVGAMPVKSDDYLTKHYSKLCVAFAEKGLPEETMQEERLEVANKAISYLEEAEEFDLGEFEARALATPERIEQFEAFKTEYEEEGGHSLEDKFTVSKAEAKKARKRLKSRLKLDVGVEIQFSSGFIAQSDHFLERGHDEERGMEYVKVWFYSEI